MELGEEIGRSWLYQKNNISLKLRKTLLTLFYLLYLRQSKRYDRKEQVFSYFCQDFAEKGI